MSQDSFTYNFAADGDVSFSVEGSFRVNVSGNFGGGTIKLQERMSAGVFEDVADTGKTAAADYIVDNFGSNSYIANLNGATSPDMNITVKAVKGKLVRQPS